MPSLRRLPARKWLPALIFGHIEVEHDLDLEVVRGEPPAPGDQPSVGLLQRALRLVVQDAKMFADVDEF